MAEERAFEFEVAISFLSQDEPVACQIAERLAPLNVFVYSGQQERLAGADGIEEFSTIFCRRSRVNLILYREGWGETKVTAIEQNAIKQRCFEGDWSHMVTVNMVSEAKTPAWMVPWKIWFDYAQYPIEQLIGAIKAKVLELGGEPRNETAIEIGLRRARQEEFERETRILFDSPTGVEQGNAAANRMFEKLVQACEKLRAGGMASKVKSEPGIGSMTVQMYPYRLSLNWLPFGNSVHGCEIDARIWTVHRHTGEIVGEVENLTRVIGRARSGIVWRAKATEAGLSSDDFADLLLRALIERSHGSSKPDAS